MIRKMTNQMNVRYLLVLRKFLSEPSGEYKIKRRMNQVQNRKTKRKKKLRRMRQTRYQRNQRRQSIRSQNKAFKISLRIQMVDLTMTIY